MNNTGKAVVFVSGIAVGAIASVLAVMSINSSNKTITQSQPTVTKPVEDAGNTTPVENETEKETMSVNPTGETLVLKTIPLVVEDNENDYYPNIDNNSKLYDSLVNANGNLNFEITGSNEVVKKEKLLKVSKVKVVKKVTEKTKQAADTLLNTVNLKADTYPDHLEIEFWQTPLNSKGYRAGKNKIAIYGLDPETLFELFLLNEGLFLRNANSVFKIEKSPEFKPLRIVTDKEILAQLN